MFCGENATYVKNKVFVAKKTDLFHTIFTASHNFISLYENGNH